MVEFAFDDCLDFHLPCLFFAGCLGIGRLASWSNLYVMYPYLVLHEALAYRKIERKNGISANYRSSKIECYRDDLLALRLRLSEHYFDFSFLF